MTLLRSGLVHFVSVTLVTGLILIGLLYPANQLGSWTLVSFDTLRTLLIISIVTLPTSIFLMILARRGRWQPVADGVSSMACISVLACLVLYAAGIYSPPMLGVGYVMFVWIYCGLGLAALIPAHLICYFALRNTPLLRGLAPSRKSKGPAEASP